ncbi:Beta-galactosidase 6 [Carex littledalei]|uniref:Beta-galactosidase 6 n=1 Tax=Carex littledalei TaxID=544730 RepID=A0A833VHY3_9POAL|nr:Beta-galactosidase 6 [Carex littledalei]
MAPLDEYGLVWQPTWAHLKQLHATVKQSARPLLYGTYSNLSLGNLTEAHVFQTGSNCVAFLVNANLHGKVDIQFRNNKFELLARSVIILSQCNKIIFNTAEVTAQSYTRSSKVLQFLNDASKWSWTSERIPDLKGAKFANKLLDQLSTTKDATDYLWYITSAHGNDQDPTATLEANFVPNKGDNTISLLSVMVGSPVKEPIQQLAKRIKAEVQ